MEAAEAGGKQGERGEPEVARPRADLLNPVESGRLGWWSPTSSWCLTRRMALAGGES